jgi:aspartate/methionine/tyrosine aminotransferase
LYQKFNIKTIPGNFLGRIGMGNAYIRVALVHKSDTIKEALMRIKKLKDSYGK